MKLYLLEAYDPDLEYNDGTVVSLTPEVCYHLDKVGIDYNIIEDYYIEDELFPDREGFLREQSDLFEKFDDLLRDNVKDIDDCNVNIATLYSHRLKTNVIDPVIFKANTLQQLFTKSNVSDLVFVSLPYQETSLDPSLSYKGKSVYGRLVPLLCDKYSIKYTEITGMTLGENKRISGSNKRNIKSIVNYSLSILKHCSLFIHKKNKKKCLNIFQLNLGYGGFKVVKDATAHGHTVYFIRNDKIWKFSSFCIRRFAIKSDYDIDYHGYEGWQKAVSLLDNHELIEWINEKCSLDVSDIVLPNLKYFILSVCPEILGYHKFFRSFFENEKIDVVISPFMQSIRELSAISAAQNNDRVKTVCNEHGDDILNELFWRKLELLNFDIVAVSNKENKESLENICKYYNLKSKVVVHCDRMAPFYKIKKLRSSERSKIKIDQHKNEVVFLPTFLTWDSLRIDTNIHLSPTKYYLFQKQILKCFSEITGYQFIWKGLFFAEPIYNPIPKLLKDKNYLNIKVDDIHFSKYANSASKVFFDYPSTGMYESTISGIPTMSLCSNFLKTRQTGDRIFEAILMKYSTTEEAIDHIQQFIDADCKEYLISLESCEKSFIDEIDLEFYSDANTVL